ncbi:hypothetical protein [Methylocapsa sp. S129]|uniref:hypothetical protein n=1 Tax=Methylocapsa sp. S129 TaxID=1641869 RepID=UPI00131D352A|nr:hypothetical protein [Methylocapsa sp. S129]
MFTVDHINELRAELAECVFTKTERAKLKAELAALIAQRDMGEQDEADAALQVLRNEDAGR